MARIYAFVLTVLFSMLAGCEDSILQPIEEHSAEPSAVLDAATFTGGYSALNGSGTATLEATFEHAHHTTLTATTGTSAAPPAGLHITTSGTAACSSIEISNSSSHGATIEISGCTGNGTIGVQIEENTIENQSGAHNEASNTRTITVDNARPTATLAVTNPVVGLSGGANVATVTFSERVAALTTNNANAEFTVSGCTTTNPTVAIAMSVNGSNQSVATATLTGGSCADGNAVTITFHLDKATDLAGNAGLALSSPTPATYDVDLTAPVATLAVASYPASTTALSSSSAATLALTLTNAASTTLVNATGTDSSPPTGLTVGQSGTASCNVATSSATTAGATITVNNCSGDGSLTITAAAAIATSAGSLTNVASATRTVVVQTTAPAVSSIVAQNPVGGSDGANVVTITMNQLIQAVSVSNADLAIVISGCATTQPAASIANSDDGAGHSVLTITLSGGVCNSLDTVSVGVDTTKIDNLAGASGSVNPSPVTYSIP